MWFAGIACFATIPPLANIYGDGVVYKCVKTIYPWVFTALNFGTFFAGFCNLILYCKYRKEIKETIK